MPKAKAAPKPQLVSKGLKFNRLQVLILILALAVIGVVLVYKSHAATNNGWSGLLATNHCPTASGSAFPGTIQLSSSGNCVKLAQFLLELASAHIGSAPVENGSYTIITNDYVREFQSHSGLPVTGTIDPNTWAKLDNCTNDLSKTIAGIWTCPSIALIGDLNHDGHVNVADAALMKANFGKTGVGLAGGDLNLDGVVNVYDLTILEANFVN